MRNDFISWPARRCAAFKRVLYRILPRNVPEGTAEKTGWRRLSGQGRDLGATSRYSQYGSLAHSSMTRLGCRPPRWWCLLWEERRSCPASSSSSLSSSLPGAGAGCCCAAGRTGCCVSRRWWSRRPLWWRERSLRSFLRCPDRWPCGVRCSCPACCGCCDDCGGCAAGDGCSPVLCGCGFSSAMVVRLINRGRNHKKHSVLPLLSGRRKGSGRRTGACPGAGTERAVDP
ncbi:MAG: hypothetical protein A4E34_01788 [Methanoregula sp. PtaU1.Bin006]|nr:MAG: hypothetical protein A4E33_01848 [Methanoregula sp. PtaB.Bin085]OPY33465.1 MAG: hypothetical protein A4E34_01788 [Methanoregula sp. PtaU1.Bin006]